MTKGDQLVDSAATRLQGLADKASAEGGVTAKLAQPLADDAAFLRKLKPSLIKARAKGEEPTNKKPTAGTAAASGRKRSKPRGGPNPFLVLGVALAAGILIAKFIDWRGDADPRD